MDDREIADPDVACVVCEGSSSGLARSSMPFWHVFLNRTPAGLDAQFEELSANALCAPEEVSLDHPLDQCDGLGGDALSAILRPRLGGPMAVREFAMPAQPGGSYLNQMSFLDSLILNRGEEAPDVAASVTWNARHYQGKTSSTVLAPDEYLER